MTDTTPVPKAPNDVPDDSGLANATGAIPTGASDGPGLASAPGAIPADGPAPDFASLLGGLDLGGLLQQAQAMQAQLAQAQTDLAGMRFSGTAGGGLVAATVSGQGELLSVEISPQAVDPEDAETLGDLVVAAVREATAKARRVAEASVPQVPGF